MKSISIRDVIVSIISSIAMFILFAFVISTVLLFSFYIVMAILITIFGIFLYPLIGEFPSVSDILGAGSGVEIYAASLKLMLGIFTEWAFYVLIIIVSIIDVFIRKIGVRIVTDSMYVNGLVCYFMISVLLSFLFMVLPSFQFDGSTFNFIFSIVLAFFLAHFHLSLLLAYTLQKGPKLFKKVKVKMKKYSVEDNDSEF